VCWPDHCSSTQCNTPATLCNTPLLTHTATQRNSPATLGNTPFQTYTTPSGRGVVSTSAHQARNTGAFATLCNTHCNTLQHTAIHHFCHILQLAALARACMCVYYSAIHWNTLQDTCSIIATYQRLRVHHRHRCVYTTLWHTATHCNTLQHITANTHYSQRVWRVRQPHHSPAEK